MLLPEFDATGSLPPGIHLATLKETLERFGVGSEARQLQRHLLELVVEAALHYPTIKRVLVWGSFVTVKPEPNDLDYSLVVSVEHSRAQLAPEHRRFIVPLDARQFYGLDRGYLIIRDYPLEPFIGQMDFICRRDRRPCGIFEISLRGETAGDAP